MTGSSVNSLITSIETNLTTINNNMANSFDQLTEFLKSQVASYSDAYQSALSMLTSALSFIEQNF